MKRFIFGAIGIIVIGIGIYSLLRKPATPSTSQAPQGTNVIVFGDSLAAGYGSTHGNDLASNFTKDLNLTPPAIDSGKNGDTTQTALQRLDADVLQQDPKIVIIILGANDFFTKQPLQQTTDNLNSIIGQIQAKGARVVLVSFDNGLISSYNNAYKKIAADKKTAFVSKGMAGIFSNKSLMYDAIHPNDAGYKVFAGRIEPEIKKLLQQ